MQRGPRSAKDQSRCRITLPAGISRSSKPTTRRAGRSSPPLRRTNSRCTSSRSTVSPDASITAGNDQADGNPLRLPNTARPRPVIGQLSSTTNSQPVCAMRGLSHPNPAQRARNQRQPGRICREFGGTGADSLPPPASPPIASKPFGIGTTCAGGALKSLAEKNHRPPANIRKRNIIANMGHMRPRIGLGLERREDAGTGLTALPTARTGPDVLQQGQAAQAARTSSAIDRPSNIAGRTRGFQLHQPPRPRRTQRRSFAHRESCIRPRRPQQVRRRPFEQRMPWPSVGPVRGPLEIGAVLVRR